MSLPSVSIVTPTYNQGQYIEKTIQSILQQNYPNLEYIIIDGGSTDNTIDIIKKYEKHLKFWVSEKDNGQANAINKGLQHCTGEIFNWINSDDYLEEGALLRISNAFAQGADMVAGKVRLFKENETLEYVQHSKLSSKGLMFWLRDVQFVQPGVWMKRDLVQKCGGINESYHYSFDWDLYIRYLAMFNNIRYIDDLLIHFRYHDESKTVTQQTKFLQEQEEIIKQIAQSNENKKLRNMGRLRLTGKQWMQFLQETMNDKSKLKRQKILSIINRINLENTPHWRATAGALKKILIE